MAQHKTRRGELMAALEGKKIGSGLYTIRGYEVKMIREASGSKPGLWLISNTQDELAEVPNLTAALEMISQWIERDAALATNVVPEVEVIEEASAPVAPEVPAEPVVAEVQEDVVPIVAPAPRKTRTPKTRRTELLVKLGARTIGTAEYDVAGHHVEYVAPGVMPRNAGGRWRTTLMSASGVITNWNLSLTAALEVVERRVAEANDSPAAPVASSSVRQYVAVYTSDRKNADLCELHAPGCADLGRTGKRTDPQVDVEVDLTDEDATMLVLDPDELGYDLHAVNVMPCAQHAPLAQNVSA